MTTVITPADYFAAHTNDVKNYVNVVVAYPIAKDEHYVVTDHLTFHDRKTAKENGYLASLPPGVNEDFGYVSAQNMANRFYDLSDAAPVYSPEDLPEGTVLTAVAKGEDINVGFKNNVRYRKAPVDGFVAAQGGKREFYSNYDLRMLFNVVADKKETHEELVLGDASSAPVQGVRLTNDVNLYTGPDSDPFEAKAGDILVKDNDGKEDSYGIIFSSTARVAWRMAPEQRKPLVLKSAP